jgi:RNA-binding protein with serine-rich domain 1
VTKEHIQEIFQHFGKINKIEHSIDRRTNLPMESCYLYFAEKSDAEKAIEYMDRGQLDGVEIRVQFTLRPNQRQGSPRRNRGGMGGGRKWGTNNNRQRSPPRSNYNNRRGESPIHSRKRNNSRSNSQSPKRIKAQG